MTRRTVAVTSMYYLFLPLAIFLCSWVKLWIGIPLTILLGIAPIFMLKDVRGGGETVTGSLRQETTVFFVLLIWVVLSGIGGYVWQNRWDHFFRNAVFMDLVERPWPVQSDGNALVYYLGFWLPSALVAKLTHSLETGYLMQLVYGFIGIYLAFRLTIDKIGSIRLRYLLPFLLFSGVDIVYYLLFNEPVPRNFHIELWNGIAFWEGNTTLLNWVYNQAIPSWVATMLILDYGKERGIPAITLCFLMLSAPFSAVGLFPLSLYYVFCRLKGCRSEYKGFFELFNPFNILAVVGVMPVCSYFLLNSSTDTGLRVSEIMNASGMLQILLLLTLEILVFIPFIYGQIKKSPEFYILLSTCILCLFIKMGHSLDFNGRVELPLNFYMTLQIAVFLRDWKTKTKICRCSFIIISAFSLVTPVLETARIVWQTIRQPASEYRSIRYDSTFDMDVLRGNFVADSIVSAESRPKIRMLRYSGN